MLHYRERNQRIHIITLDRVLATDVYERLCDCSGMESVEAIQPGNGKSAIAVEDIQRLARDTTTSRVLIMDVRRQTKTQLQHAYSDIVRFNRPDFNRYCYTVLIGDGPRNLLQPGRGLDAFQTYLADLRIDYSPAVFFSDPFLHYSHDEIQEMVLYRSNSLPERIPHCLEKAFKGHRPTVERVHAYFRAADVPDVKRANKKTERQSALEKFYHKRFEKDFPDDKDQFIKSLSKEGCALPGESLRLNVYPFFFEEWVLDLTRRAESAVCG